MDAAPVIEFTASQVVDMLLELFNSDLTDRPQKLTKCFAAGDAFTVAVLRMGEVDKRPVTLKGTKAVGAVVAASSRLASAEVRLRLFVDTGVTAQSFALDWYRAGEAPGLAAVKKGGIQADTVVLYRVSGNVITHAWLAPDRDAFVARWENVTESDVLASKAASAMMDVLEECGSPEASFHFNNYCDIPTIGA